MNPIRACIEEVLKGNQAFLRCSRDQSLYVTDLPIRSPDQWEAVSGQLSICHISGRLKGKMLFLSPGDEWIDPFEKWILKQISPGPLTLKLFEKHGCPICAEERECWITGIKQLEIPDRNDYERYVRQTAAIALRRKCGGLLACCGLCLDMMKGC